MLGDQRLRRCIQVGLVVVESTTPQEARGHSANSVLCARSITLSPVARIFAQFTPGCKVGMNLYPARDAGVDQVAAIKRVFDRK